MAHQPKRLQATPDVNGGSSHLRALTVGCWFAHLWGQPLGYEPRNLWRLDVGYPDFTQLDDEDFLRIVGNQQALDAHREYRETGLAMNKWGKVMIAGGVAAFIGSYFMPVENYTLRYGLSTGGLLIGSGGWYFARMGAARFEPEAHTVDPSRANYDMQRYNRSLAGGGSEKPQASLSIGKKF